jgi:hypothetical protein
LVQTAPGSFDKHVAEEQNPSHYVFLLRKLELQPVEADTQQEAFVRQQVNQGSIAFFPLEAMCMQAKHDDSEGGDIKVFPLPAPPRHPAPPSPPHHPAHPPKLPLPAPQTTPLMAPPCPASSAADPPPPLSLAVVG